MAGFNFQNNASKKKIPTPNDLKKKGVPYKQVSTPAVIPKTATPSTTATATVGKKIPTPSQLTSKVGAPYKATKIESPVVSTTGKSYLDRVMPSATPSASATTNVPVASTPAKKYEAGPLAGIAYGLASSAVTTFGDAIRYLTGATNQVAAAVKEGVGLASAAFSGSSKIDEKYLDSYDDKMSQISLAPAKVDSSNYFKKGDSIGNIAKALNVNKKLTNENKDYINKSSLLQQERSYDIYNGLYNESGISSKGFNFIKNKTATIANDLNARADLQDENVLVRGISDTVNSAPYTLEAMIPGVGILLTYGSSYIGSMDQKNAEVGADVSQLTQMQKANIMHYTAGSALINSLAEALFPEGKGALTLAKSVATGATKDVAKNVVKLLIRNGMDEASEQGISYIGNGLVAAQSTDPGKTLFGIASNSALINIADLSTQMGQAFIMGVAFTGVGLGGSYVGGKVSEKYNGFVNSKKAYENIKDTPLQDLTVEQIKEGTDAISLDLKNEKNKAVVQAQAAESLGKAEQELPINEQVGLYQKLIQKMYADDTSKLSPEEVVSRNDYISALQEKISILKNTKTAGTPSGKKYSAEQLTTIVAQKEAYVASLKANAPTSASTNAAVDYQKDIRDATDSLNQFKSLLKKVAQPEPTSADLLEKAKQDMEPKYKVSEQSGKFVILVKTDSKFTNDGYDYEKGYDGVRQFDTRAAALREIRRMKKAPTTAQDGKVSLGDEILQPNTENASNEVVGSQTASSEEIAGAPSGDEVEFVVRPGKDQVGTIKAVPASSLIASTDADANTNPAFDKRLQPRDTDRRGTAALIADIAFKTHFRSLVGVETLQVGSPVVGANGMVVTGNHRVAGILRMMRDNRAVYDKYKEYIRSNAKKYGLNADELTGDFIMVRVLPEGTDLVSLVDIGNDSGVAKMSSSEIAVNDSKNLTDSIMKKFVPDENGEMSSEESRRFADIFINEVVTESERRALYDANDKLNMDGVKRIQNAIFYKAYGNLELLNLVAESTDNYVKRLTTSLINVAPRIVELRQGIKKGLYYDVPIPDLLASTSVKWATMKREKGSKDIIMYAKQRSVFDSPEEIMAKDLLIDFEDNIGSTKQLTAYFNDVIDANIAAGDPNNNLFHGDDAIVTANTIFYAASKGGQREKQNRIEQVESEPDVQSETANATVGQSENRQGSGAENNSAASEAARKPKSAGKKPKQTVGSKAEVNAKLAVKESAAKETAKTATVGEQMNVTPEEKKQANVSESSFEKKVTAESEKYKTMDDIEQMISGMQAEALGLDSLSADEKQKKIIGMNLQLFALKKALSNFEESPSGTRLHSFIDSFSKMLQVGSSKDIKKFLKDSISLEKLTYQQLANKDEIAKSDAAIADGGVAYQEELLNNFMSDPNKFLNPNENVSMSRYLVDLTKSNDADTVAKGLRGLEELSNRLTRAGQFTQSVKAALDALIPERHADALANELDNRGSDPVDKVSLKNAVKGTKKIGRDAIRNSIDNAVDGIENDFDKADSRAVDESGSGSGSGKSKPKTLEEILAALIKRDIAGRGKKAQTADQMALRVLHDIYLELNPGEKGKTTNIFNSLSIMAADKEKYGDVWDSAKPIVDAMIDKENIKREAAGLEPLTVPENYLNRYSDPDFTKRMMDQAIRQVLNYNRTDLKSEARKFFLEGGSGEETINRFVSGLRDKFDEAYGSAMPDETFNYLKDHIVKQFKSSLADSKDSISAQIRKQVIASDSKGVFNQKSRIEKTIEQLTDSVISGALSDNELSTVWAKRLGLNYISDEMRAQISQSIIEIDKIQNEDERFLAYQDFVEKLGNQIKASNTMKINAWRRFAMLCGPKTWTRNGASNYAYVPYAKVMDSLTYRIQKTMGLESQYMGRGEKYLRKGTNSEIEAVVTSMLTPAFIRSTIEENGKYSFGQHLKRESRIFESDKLEALTKAPLYMISTGTLTKNGKHAIAFFGDQGILKTHMQSAFRNKLNALGYKESLSESVKSEMKATALKYAKEVSVTRTYRSASVISELFTRMKKDVRSDVQINNLVKENTPASLEAAKKRRNEIKGLNMAVDLAVPFIVTPAAIATEGYRFSPAALFVSGMELAGMKLSKKENFQTNPEKAARLSRQFSQALVGTAGQWVLGASLLLSGAITGAPPDNDKGKKEWALEGKTAYSVNIPGVGWTSYAWCQPIAFGVMGGADIATVIKNGGYKPSALLGALAAGFNGVVGQTLYGNLVDNLFGGQSAADNVKNFLVNGVTQGLPTITKALAQTIDPYTRNTYSGSTFETLVYRVLSYIPVASMLQPVKVDVWGQPVKNQDAGIGAAGRFLLNFLAPFTLTKGKTDTVSQETIRLFNETGSTSVLPAAVSATWSKTIDGKKYSYSLTGQDYIDFQQAVGQREFELAQIVMLDSRYINASDADKVKILGKAYAKASDSVKLEYISKHK